MPKRKPSPKAKPETPAEPEPYRRPDFLRDLKKVTRRLAEPPDPSRRSRGA
jgi:hypothetical protein